MLKKMQISPALTIDISNISQIMFSIDYFQAKKFSRDWQQNQRGFANRTLFS
jgi:hypothetical protein